jgi:hypothetical protein
MPESELQANRPGRVGIAVAAIHIITQQAQRGSQTVNCVDTDDRVDNERIFF